MSRLLDIEPAQRTPEQDAVFDQLTAGRGRILAPYRVWIHSPQVAAGMEKIGTYINKKSILSVREVEIGILIIARHWHCDYVVQAHIHLGREAGLPEGVLEDLKDGRRPMLADFHEQAVYDFATGVVTGNDFNDAEFANFETVLKRQGIADLLVLLGYYSSVALAMRIHQVPPRG